ncbi:hypothetical protein [Aeromonas hydrophila]|uniref:hypothetical protein n=1 Tax=Aeromonas hydrophila TaxID=644 RepID=UPI000A709ABA|nr:hypothetical protein [Aeromonas hydrophila]
MNNIDHEILNDYYKYCIKFISAGRKRHERLFLRLLHTKEHLSFLSRLISLAYHEKNIKCNVDVSSIWIDGTPQAAFTSVNNVSLQCELADLLYIVEVQNNSGSILMKRALLLQGKLSENINQIPRGPSTLKERMLFENLDRVKPVTILSGTNASSRRIGTYNLDKSNKKGLYDCARFLNLCDPTPFIFRMTPIDFLSYQNVSWPINEVCDELEYGFNLVSAALSMGTTKNLGKEITGSSCCEWSRLVQDLEGKYDDIIMKGYGGQRRINKSHIDYFSLMCIENNDANIMRLVSSNCFYLESLVINSANQDDASSYSFILPPTKPDDFNPLPSIPIIKVKISMHEEWIKKND